MYFVRFPERTRNFSGRLVKRHISGPGIFLRSSLTATRNGFLVSLVQDFDINSHADTIGYCEDQKNCDASSQDIPHGG